MDEIFHYFDVKQEPDDRERETSITESYSDPSLIRLQQTEHAATNSDVTDGHQYQVSDNQTLNEVTVKVEVEENIGQEIQLPEILPHECVQLQPQQQPQTQVVVKGEIQSSAVAFNSAASSNLLAAFMESDSDDDANIDEIFNKKREPSELDIKLQRDRERREAEKETKNQSLDEMIKMNLWLKITELDVNRCTSRAARKMKELANKLVKILEKAAEASAITDEWLNIQFFNNVVARNDGQIIYEPMFSLCYKINNLQKNRLYDFEAVSRRLEKMYLDDRLRMKIDETERLKSIKGENARNPSDQNDAEQERERKRVFHGISRANRLALISRSSLDNSDYDVEAAKRFRLYSESDTWKEFLKDDEDEAPRASPKGEDIEIRMGISDDEMELLDYGRVEVQHPDYDGANGEHSDLLDYDLPDYQHQQQGVEHEAFQRPSTSRTRNIGSNSNTSRVSINAENANDRENPELAYRRQLRKDIVERTLNDLPESPFQATPVRKKAPSAGRKEKESRSNKQPRRQQQSTPIEQNPQLDDNDNDQPNDYDQPDESNAPFAANQNPASTLFSFSNETMNRIVDGGRILLELIINGVKKLAFDSNKKPKVSNLKSKSKARARTAIDYELRFSDDTRTDDGDVSQPARSLMNFTTVRFTHVVDNDDEEQDEAPKIELPSSDQKVTAVIRIDPEKCDKFSKREIVQMKRDLAATIGETIDNNPRASAWLLYDSILSSLRFKSPENEEIYKRMMATKIMFPNMPHWVTDALEDWYENQRRSHFPSSSIYIVLGMDLKVYYAHSERKEDEAYLEFLSGLYCWFKAKSTKQHDEKNCIVSEREVYNHFTKQVDVVYRRFFRVNQIPTLVVTTIPECGEKHRAFAALNQKLRKYVKENSKYFALLDWAELCKKKNAANVEDRTRILIHALKDNHGLLYI